MLTNATTQSHFSLDVSVDPVQTYALRWNIPCSMWMLWRPTILKLSTSSWTGLRVHTGAQDAFQREWYVPRSTLLKRDLRITQRGEVWADVPGTASGDSVHRLLLEGHLLHPPCAGPQNESRTGWPETAKRRRRSQGKVSEGMRARRPSPRLLLVSFQAFLKMSKATGEATNAMAESLI